MAPDSGIRDRLEMQGFSWRAADIEAVEPWLRATPAISTALIALGTVASSELILWLFAAVSGYASTRRVHPFDRLSNALRIRNDRGPLPVNPAPRRFAMAVAAVWAALTGALFALGLKATGYVGGGLLSLAGLAVAPTRFCVGSWLCRHLQRPKSGHSRGKRM